jgi:hypothetical protein
MAGPGSCCGEGCRLHRSTPRLRSRLSLHKRCGVSPHRFRRSIVEDSNLGQANPRAERTPSSSPGQAPRTTSYTLPRRASANELDSERDSHGVAGALILMQTPSHSSTLTSAAATTCANSAAHLERSITGSRASTLSHTELVTTRPPSRLTPTRLAMRPVTCEGDHGVDVADRRVRVDGSDEGTGLRWTRTIHDNQLHPIYADDPESVCCCPTADVAPASSLDCAWALARLPH